MMTSLVTCYLLFLWITSQPGLYYSKGEGQSYQRLLIRYVAYEGLLWIYTDLL